MNETPATVHALIQLPPFDGSGDAFHPVNLKIYGLTLLERTLRALERAGVSHATLLTGGGGAAVEKLMKKAAPWKLTFDVAEGKSTDDVLANLPTDSGVLMVAGPVVLDPAIPRQMMESGSNLVRTADGLLTLAATPARLRQKNDKAAAVFPVKEDALCHRVRDQKELRQVKKALRRSLVKPTDGWVSRHLNRPISISVSRVLAHTGITPNQFTVFTGLLGVLAAWLLAQGPYWGFMLGALLFHLTSVFDGVDGELARLKFKASPFGQWLDTLVDNSSYVLALAGFLAGLFRDGVSGFEKIAGILTLVFTALALSSMYYYLRRYNKGGSLLNIEYSYQEGKKPVDRMLKFLAPLGKRDLFALIFFGMGLIGQLHLALVFITVLTGILFGLSIEAHRRMER
jgi:phosphatidylglycerophosphate synthase